MDLQKLLIEKVSHLITSEEDRGINNVISHIEIAEKHFINGKKGDDYLFNDVIYRSNQAFEGALKEAYRILAGKQIQSTTPYKIEKYLEENKILRERVLQQFINYRTQWRNVSTHDHTVYFSEQEAFLAIVSISAFISILLDQMIERKAYENEIAYFKRLSKDIFQKPQSEVLVERIINTLQNYVLTIPSLLKGTSRGYLSEAELAGSLMAYFINSDAEIEIYREVPLVIENNQGKYYADFIFSLNNEKIIMEIKNGRTTNSFKIESGVEQVLKYLSLSDANIGILFVPSMNEKQGMQYEKEVINLGLKDYTIHKLYPKK